MRRINVKTEHVLPTTTCPVSGTAFPEDGSRLHPELRGWGKMRLVSEALQDGALTGWVMVVFPTVVESLMAEMGMEGEIPMAVSVDSGTFQTLCKSLGPAGCRVVRCEGEAHPDTGD